MSKESLQQTLNEALALRVGRLALISDCRGRQTQLRGILHLRMLADVHDLDWHFAAEIALHVTAPTPAIVRLFQARGWVSYDVTLPCVMKGAA